MLVALLSVAIAAPPEETTVPTMEGDSLVVMKKGRGDYKFWIESAGKGDDITCTAFTLGLNAGMYRTPLGASLKAAGERANGSMQVGNIIPLNTAGLSQTAGLPGICALGVDAMPGSVLLTMATMSKLNGRTATLAPEHAIAIGSFLLE